MTPLPRDFVDLASAYRSPPNSFVDIIGTVVDLQPATATTREYMLTFKLLDETLRDSLHGSQGLPVRFFKDTVKALPEVRQHGDVVLIRNLKITVFNGTTMALSHYSTMVLVFSNGSIPAPNYELAFQNRDRLMPLATPLDIQRLTPITLEQQAYVVHIKQEMTTTVDALPEYRVSSHP